MDDPVANSMVASGILDSLLLLIFIFRLWIRIRMQRVGWEDIWAIVAFLCGMLNVISDWVYVVGSGVGQSSMIAMWIYMFTYTCLMWAVRISIIFSIIRIIPAKERLHIYGLMIISLFLLTCSALIVQKAISCIYAYHAFQSIPPSPYHRCAHLHTLSISELAVGFIADIVTVGFPLYVLRRVTLSPKYLRLLRLLFSSNMVVSIMCFLRLACQVVPELTSWSILVTNFQIATCLIVCNLLVVVTYLYRVLRCQKRGTTGDTTEKGTTTETTDLTTPPSIPEQMTLTTIELLFSTQSEEHMSIAADETRYHDQGVLLP